MPDEVAESAVETAVKAGYRHIDTAKAYGNEEGVGRCGLDNTLFGGKVVSPQLLRNFVLLLQRVLVQTHQLEH